MFAFYIAFRKRLRVTTFSEKRQYVSKYCVYSVSVISINWFFAISNQFTLGLQVCTNQRRRQSLQKFVRSLCWLLYKGLLTGYKHFNGSQISNCTLILRSARNPCPISNLTSSMKYRETKNLIYIYIYMYSKRKSKCEQNMPFLFLTKQYTIYTHFPSFFVDAAYVPH